MRTAALTMLLFADAAAAWLETRKPYISARTAKDYRHYIKTLSAFFGEMRLPEIASDQIRAYQRARMMQGCGGVTINHECSVLQQILKRIGRWGEIEHDYDPLPLPKESPGRAISEVEEERFFRAAFSNPAWEMAAWCCLISINTSAGSGELRTLRLKDVDVLGRTIRVNPVEGAKRPERARVLPLNESAFWALSLIMARAKELGVCEPHHYIMPFRVHRNFYDVTRPCQGWRTAFEAILATAGLEFRQYDLRHTAITRMLENPDLSEETVIAMAGHVSNKMLKRYSHVRIQSKWQAVTALQRKPPDAVKRFLGVESPARGGSSTA